MKCLWSGEFQEESPLSNPHEVCFHTGASQDCDTVDMPRLAKGGPHTHGQSLITCTICKCPMRSWHFRILHRRPPGYLHPVPVLGGCKPEFLVGCRPSNPGGHTSLPQKRLCLCLLLNISRLSLKKFQGLYPSMGLTSFLFTYPFDRQSLSPGPPLVW